jgi:hypothetical protein
MNRFIFIFGLIILVFLASLSLAGIPKMINYQGMLTGSDGTTPVTDGNYSLTFKIYGSESGTDSLWRENHPTVQVTNGLFNVILGSVTSLNLAFDTDYWLGIRVGSDAELSPRIRLTSVGYAYRAKVADSAVVAGGGGWVDDGSVVRLQTSTDSVGIGTTSPRAILDVYGSSNKLRLSSDDSNYTDIMTESDGDLFISPSSGKVWVNMDTTNEHLYPKSYFTILAGSQPPLQQIQMIGLNVISESATEISIDGIDVWVQAIASGSLAKGMRISANGDPGVSRIDGINVSASGNGATVAYGLYSSASGAINSWAGYFTNGNVYIQNYVGIGTTTPSYKLDVVGNIHCTGILVSDGGYDPPYVLYNRETRESIKERVAKEVPEDKLDGAVLFWNGADLRFEVYLPARGEFRDLLGNLLAKVPGLDGRQ